MPNDPLPPLSAASRTRPGGQVALEEVIEFERLNQLHTALRQVSQAILRARSESELFQRVCEILVAAGGFPMAWIGCSDLETRRLVPVAQAGDATGYLQSMALHLDGLEGSAPSGRAFHEDRAYVCNDLLADPATLHWRTEIERRGFRACAAFPIRRAGVVCGTLSIYAASAGVFRDPQLALLSEVATDIAFALDKLTREAVAEAEQRLASGLV